VRRGARVCSIERGGGRGRHGLDRLHDPSSSLPCVRKRAWYRGKERSVLLIKVRDVVLGVLELGLAHGKVVVELKVGVGVILIPKRGRVVIYRHAAVGKVREVV